MSAYMGCRYGVLVCVGPTCGESRQSESLLARLRAAVNREQLDEKVHVTRETCLGHCQRGPTLLVCPVGEQDTWAQRNVRLDTPGAVVYTRLTAADVEKVVEQHLRDDRIVLSLIGRPEVKVPQVPIDRDAT